MQYSNLPNGCTNADIDRAMGGNIGEEECPDCNGEGHTGSDCCGWPFIVGDNGICPHCLEHSENAKCDTCDGKGEVTFDIDARRRELKAEADEKRWEERQERRRMEDD